MFTVICTEIKSNSLYAIHLFTKEDEKYLKITKETYEEKSIEGIIGGNWGKSLVHKNEPNCCSYLCIIV